MSYTRLGFRPFSRQRHKTDLRRILENKTSPAQWRRGRSQAESRVSGVQRVPLVDSAEVGARGHHRLKGGLLRTADRGWRFCRKRHRAGTLQAHRGGLWGAGGAQFVKVKGANHSPQHALGALSALWKCEKRRRGQTRVVAVTGEITQAGEICWVCFNAHAQWKQRRSWWWRQSGSYEAWKKWVKRQTDTRREAKYAQKSHFVLVFLPIVEGDTICRRAPALMRTNSSARERTSCKHRRGRDLQPALSQSPIYSDRRMSESEACTFRSRSVKPSHQSHQTETEANVSVHCWGKRCVMKMTMGSGEMWLAQRSTLFLPSTGLTGSSGLQAVQDKAKSWQFSSWQGGERIQYDTDCKVFSSQQRSYGKQTLPSGQQLT